MISHFNISEKYTFSLIRDLLKSRELSLENDEIEAINYCRRYLENRLQDNTVAHYGINTGFGSLCDVRIPSNQIVELQHNLVRSHACGAGAMIEEEVVRMMLLLKIISLSGGYSGVRLELVQFLIDLYNRDILPVVFEHGSLGASGDLAPLAHLALVVIGEGEVLFQGQRHPTAKVLSHHDIRPLELQAKEGLALLNGTQFSTAHALKACLDFERISSFAHATAALSMEAFNCSTDPLDGLIHMARNQEGQQKSASIIRDLLHGSDIAERRRYSVQDPYAFRCVPQVYGATLDTFEFVSQSIRREISGVTDNPNIFADDNKILSGGNFHAQPIAYACDFLAIAAAELASISERRIYQLINGHRDLPAFLTKHAGTHSGLMIPQYTAASIVSQNKQLCTPASIDSITSSNGQEDHVSMAANASTKLLKVIDNIKTVLSIEWMTAAQALEFRHDYRIGNELYRLFGRYRSDYVKALGEDRILHVDIMRTRAFFEDHF